MNIFRYTFKSFLSRKLSVVLCVLGISIAFSLFFIVQATKLSAQNTFFKSVANVDLLVGAKGSPLQLTLYSIFRIGGATANFSFKEYKKLIKENKNIKWAIPISLGDSFQNFRVIATNNNYFKYFQYGKKQSLSFNAGNKFKNFKHVVLGANVADKNNFKIGDVIYINHGVSSGLNQTHSEHPFTISGILNFTGTPVDNSLHINLQAMEWIHGPAAKDNFRISSITAAMIKLNDSLNLFETRSKINSSKSIMAIMPSQSLLKLWSLLGHVDKLLGFTSFLILLVAIFGLVSSLVNNLAIRLKEFKILRAIGKSKKFIYSLLAVESFFICTIAFILSLATLLIVKVFVSNYLQQWLKMQISWEFPISQFFAFYIIAILLSLLACILPGFLIYKKTV